MKYGLKIGLVRELTRSQLLYLVCMFVLGFIREHRVRLFVRLLPMTNPELSVSYQEQAIHARDKPCTEPRFGIDHSRFPESRICIYRLVRQFKPNKDSSRSWMSMVH